MTELHGYIFEPWHWRFVGEEVATKMFDQGITTFEEFHGRFIVTPTYIPDRTIYD
jgi:D-alanyl-D-alanine carboxypeptidase